jgi:hypothetical protein
MVEQKELNGQFENKYINNLKETTSILKGIWKDQG